MCVCVCVCVCVVGFGVWTVSDSVRSFCYVPVRRRCHVWASLRTQGAAPALWLQLYVRCASRCRARGGCRAPVSVSDAAVAQGAV